MRMDEHQHHVIAIAVAIWSTNAFGRARRQYLYSRQCIYETNEQCTLNGGDVIDWQCCIFRRETCASICFTAPAMSLKYLPEQTRVVLLYSLLHFTTLDVLTPFFFLFLC